MSQKEGALLRLSVVLACCIALLLTTTSSWVFGETDPDQIFGKADPVQKSGLRYDLTLSTQLGGTHYDVGNAVAVDGAGNAYVAGWTSSPKFPYAPDPQGLNQGPECDLHGGAEAADLSVGACGDAFVAKFSEGGKLVYLSLLGGKEGDSALDLAVDSAGSAFVAGVTSSGKSMAPANALAHGPTGKEDGFVAKLGPDGKLSYMVLLGGSGPDRASGIALDSDGKPVVAGSTQSADFPLSAGIPGTPGDRNPGFLARLSPEGKTLEYSTHIPGGPVQDVAVDNKSKVYVTGISPRGLTVKNAFQPEPAGQFDAFVAKLDPSISGVASLVYSTYLGGSGMDVGQGIAVDSRGQAFVTGVSSSKDFPVKSGEGFAGGPGVFAVKLANEGSSLLFSTRVTSDPLLPESGPSASSTFVRPTSAGQAPVRPVELPFQRRGSIALDDSGNALITGFTSGGLSLNGSAVNKPGGGADAFLVKLAAKGPGRRGPEWSTYLGGEGLDSGRGLTVSPDGKIFLTGYTQSSGDFPSIRGPQKAGVGRSDSFLTRLVPRHSSFPAIQEIFPKSGPVSGGTRVVLKGSGFVKVSKVLFGRIAAKDPELSEDGESISVLAPPQKDPGATAVTVKAKGKTSRPVAGSSFVYGYGSWTSIQSPVGSQATTTLLENGKVLSTGGCPEVGGTCTKPTNRSYVFDPAGRKWQLTASMGVARKGHTATFLQSGKVLVIGGAQGAPAEVFDPASGKWSPVGVSVDELSVFNHTATLLKDGKILITGGAGRSRSAYLFDPATGTGEATQAMAGGRDSGHTATPLPDGRVLVVGGFCNACGRSSPSEVFDPATRTWGAAGENIPRAFHTATSLNDGRVVFVGGVTPHAGGSPIVGSVEAYLPRGASAGEWKPLASLAVPRFAHVAAPLEGNKVLVAGGSYTPRDRTSGADVYLAEQDRWAPAGKMAVARGLVRPARDPAGTPAVDISSFSANGLKDNRVLVAGGAGRTADLFDPNGGTAGQGAGKGFGERLPGLPLTVGGSIALLLGAGLMLRRLTRNGRR